MPKNGRLAARTAVPAALRMQRAKAKKDDGRFAAHVVDSLAEQLKHLGAEHSGRASTELSPDEWQRHVDLYEIMQNSGRLPVLDVKIPVGAKIISPPYDHDWAQGAGMPLAKLDGKMIVVGQDGFSAAGVSVLLSTDTPVIASIAPQGDYDWSWAAVQDDPGVLTRGGLGLTVYAGGDPTPLRSEQAVLWDVRGVHAFTGAKGNGRFADAVAPGVPGGFGPIRLSPMLINMVPGTSYEVWIWSWQVMAHAAHPLLAFLRCTVPLVLVDAGPPTPIH